MIRFRTSADVLLPLQSLDLPDNIICRNGTAFSAKLSLAIALRRFAFPCRLCELARFFERDQSQLSRIFNCTNDMTYEKKGIPLQDLIWITAD